MLALTLPLWMPLATGIAAWRIAAHVGHPRLPAANDDAPLPPVRYRQVRDGQLPYGQVSPAG